jgi:3-mercaptopyruvate sulfurtransferase SseA
MSKIKIILIAALCVGMLSACSAFAPTAEPTPTYITEASVPRVSIEEARVALESGAAIIVDVRSKQAYDESHIPGAINILLGEFETNINSIALDKDQWIITYCT